MILSTVGELIDFLSTNYSRDLPVMKSDPNTFSYLPVELRGPMVYWVKSMGAPLDDVHIDAKDNDDHAFNAVVL